MDLGSLHFIRPLWLLCLPLAILVPFVWRHFRRPSGDWSKICDPHLLRWLSVGNPVDKPSRAGAVLSALALSVAAVALAGPSWEKLPDASYSARDARVLVLDLSMSMLAEDLKPNRLTQARFRLMDMLDATREGQVGLVAYAGDAYVVSPLTSDMNTISNMLPALQPDIIPVAGSRADRGLLLAAELLKRAGIPSGEILLISDSAEASDAAIATELAAQGIYTSVLAVGTREGAPIPSGGGFVSDQAGNVVITRLDLESLAAVASGGIGRLSQLDSSNTSVSPWLERDSGGFSLRDDALGERWKDTGPWLVLLLLPLVALGFRRGLLFAFPVVLLPAMFFSAPAQAGLWDDLWLRKDQQAQRALRNDDADIAAQLAVDPAIAGEAHYRNGEFDVANRAWAQTHGKDALYNRGNALALAGDLEGAISAYGAALDIDPEMEDAQFNKALIEQLKEQQDQQQEQEQNGEEGEQSDEQSEQEGEGEPQEGEGDESEQDQEGQEGEPSQQDLEVNWSEEDAQAMEQWLRRIPDDPGGLLRRKFRNQHQKRGAPGDEKEAW